MLIVRTLIDKRLKVIHDRGIASLEDSINERNRGNVLQAARSVGRYQGYHDAWYLLNQLINPMPKGGD